MRTRPTSDKDRPLLQPGDECWLLLGTQLYEVAVTEVRSLCEDDPKMHFYMYRVKSELTSYYFINNESHHRQDLFRRPSEVEELRQRIESDIESLNYQLNELEDVGVVDDGETT